MAQDHISERQVTRIRYDLRSLQDHFPGLTVAELSAPRLIAYLERGKPAMKTYNNRRGIVSTLFKFAFNRGWILENPIAKVPHHRIRRKRGPGFRLPRRRDRFGHDAEEPTQGTGWMSIRRPSNAIQRRFAFDFVILSRTRCNEPHEPNSDLILEGRRRPEGAAPP